MKTQNTALKPLDQKSLAKVAGGARTDKATCDEAGMKWTADKGTKNDGKGKCSA
jgi:hypothetical protein